MKSLRTVSVGALCVVMLMGVAPSRADQLSDEAAIKQLASNWQDAWNRKDANAMTDLLAEDVDFVTVLGPKGWLKGRGQFREAHAKMFTTLFADSTWATNETHVKFVQPDLASASELCSSRGTSL